jgi:hypothetical protein
MLPADHKLSHPQLNSPLQPAIIAHIELHQHTPRRATPRVHNFVTPPKRRQILPTRSGPIRLPMQEGRRYRPYATDRVSRANRHSEHPPLLGHQVEQDAAYTYPDQDVQGSYSDQDIGESYSDQDIVGSYSGSGSCKRLLPDESRCSDPFI